MGFARFENYDDDDHANWWQKGRPSDEEISPPWAHDSDNTGFVDKDHIEHITDLIEDDFIKAYNMIALKTLWDFVFSAVAMEKVEMDRLLEGITTSASEQVVERYMQTFGSKMDNTTRSMIALAEKRATANFRNLYKDPIVQPSLLGWLRRKFKKGLKT